MMLIGWVRYWYKEWKWSWVGFIRTDTCFGPNVHKKSVHQLPLELLKLNKIYGVGDIVGFLTKGCVWARWKGCQLNHKWCHTIVRTPGDEEECVISFPFLLVFRFIFSRFDFVLYLPYFWATSIIVVLPCCWGSP